MTVIIKDVPGVGTRDVLDALHDISPNRPIQTGHGGFVVDEETALEFLSAYLRAMGRLAPIEPEPAASAPAEEFELPKRRTTRKGARS